MKDNLNGFQKLVSTRWTFSISIGLERRDPRLKKMFYEHSKLKYEVINIFSIINLA